MAQEHYKQYIIPENISEGGKWWGIRRRNLAEGVVMATVVCLPVVMLMGISVNTLPILIVLGGPLFMLGVMGISGDYFSVFVRNAIDWFRKKGPMFYNTNPRILKESPLDVALAQNEEKTNLLKKIEDMATKRATADVGKVLIEGEDFMFMDDADESDVLAARVEEAGEITFEQEFALDMPVAPVPQTTPPAVSPIPESSADVVVSIKTDTPIKEEEDLF